MAHDAHTLRHHSLTGRIIGAFFDVYSELGSGFVEKIYQRALATRLKECGLSVDAEVPFHVLYHGEDIGLFLADLVVAELVLVELKAVDALVSHHEKQLLNYLKATNLEVGLLLNFGPKPQIRRFIQDQIHSGGPPRFHRIASDRPQLWSEHRG